MSLARLPASLVSANGLLDVAMAANDAAELQAAIVSTVKAMAALKPGQADLQEVNVELPACAGALIRPVSASCLA